MAETPEPYGVKQEQQLNINIRAEEGVISIRFDRPADVIALKPLEALALAKLLIEKTMTVVVGMTDSRILKPH